MKHSIYAGLMLLCILSVIAVMAVSGVPEYMNYQGRLTNSSGEPLDTTVSMTFTIYDDSTGGNPIWTEMHGAVEVINGLFQINLCDPDTLCIDSIIPYPPAKYLGITIGDDPELVPRTLITSTPYAFSSRGVSGHIQTAPNKITIGDSSKLILRADATGPSFMLTDPLGDTAISIKGSDSSIYVAGKIHASAYTSNSPLIFEAPAGTERARFDDGTGYFGINTTTPGAKLEVFGATDASTPLLLLKHLPPSPTGILDDVFKIEQYYFGYTVLTISGGGLISQFDGSPTAVNLFNPSGDSYFNALNAKLGIGINAPTSKVHIVSTGMIPLRVEGDDQTFLERNGSTMTNLLALYNPDQTDGNGVSLNFRSDVGATPSFGFASLDVEYKQHSPASADFVFNTRDAGIWDERLRIVSDGSVGINTNNPGARTEIYGATTSSYPLLKLNHMPSSPTEILQTVFEIYNNYYGYRSFSINGAGVIEQFDGGGSARNMINPSGNTYFNAITGNVGIGTTNPQRKLHIDDVMRLEPTSAPSNPMPGDIYFDGGMQKLRVYTNNGGGQWENLN
jgi:hypothetical protein